MTKSEFWNSKISLPVISFLMFLIIVGFFLRSHDIDKKSFWEDEGATIGCAKYNLEMYVHPPLYLRILGIVIKFFGDSPTTLRLPSVLCGILLIPLTYLFSKDFFDKKTALYSAFFMAISAYSIEVSLECRMYVMEGLFSLMAVYSFWKYYQLSKRDHIIESENKESHQKGRRIFLFCYILSTIANIYTMHSGLLVFILINLFYVTFSRKYIGEWLFSNLIILMSYVPQLPVTLIQILGYRGGFKFESFHPLFLISNIVSFFSGYIFLPLQITQISSFKGNTKIQLFFMITSLYCIISVVKAVIELKKERDKLCYLALIFFPLLFFFMKMGVTPNHMVLIMPILISTTIFGLSRFSKLIFFSAFGILIICNLFAMKDYYKLMVYPFQPMDWREFAKIIEENEQPGDIVYLGGNRNILFTFRYYYKGNLPSRIYLDENDIYKLPTDYRRSDYDLKGGFLKTVESANRIWLITLRDDLILIPIIQAWMSNPSQAVFSDYVLSVNMNFNPAENSPSFKNYIEVYGQNKGYDFIPPMQIYLIEKKLI